MNALPLLAEFMGTFLLSLSVIASGANAFVVGGALALVILLVGNLSGGYVNPAISLVMFLRGSLTGMELISYVAVQMIAGAASLYAYNAFA
jgi:glycerol uptake facilitator-like aquaporin